MDQIFLVSIGSALAVIQILSPVTLLERITRVLEKIGTVPATASVCKPVNAAQKGRNYYVRRVK